MEEKRYASSWERLIAWIIGTLIFAIYIFIISSIGDSLGDFDSKLLTYAVGFAVLIYIPYFIITQSLFSVTFGMSVMKIKIYNENYQKNSYANCFWRYIFSDPNLFKDFGVLIRRMNSN